MRRLFAFILFLTASTIAAQSIDLAKIDRLSNEAIAAWRAPAVAVAIVQDDRVILARGYGVKELGKPDRVTPETLFEIASTTKAFTATAVAMLVDEKKLSWDTPVHEVLPWFHLADPYADASVTLRDLLSHRTGLTRHDELWTATTFTRDELLHHIGSVALTKPIRSAYQYNNIMYVAAGEAVAAAAKMPWEDFIRTRFFVPLQMTRSRIALDEWNAADHALSYRFDRQTDRVIPQPFHDYAVIAPAGTIKSCARDMAQWLRFQLAGGVIDGKRLLSTEALDETHMPQIVMRRDADSRETSPETNVSSYAMGWNVLDYRGEMLIAHAGALNGYRTQVALLPFRHFGVVVMTNVGRGLLPVSLRNSIIDTFLGKTNRDWNALLLAADRKSDEKALEAKKAREAKRPRDTKPSHPLDAYAGTYSSPGYDTATVVLKDGALVLNWGTLSLPLAHYAYDSFSAVDEAEDVDETVQFHFTAEGEVKSLTIFGEEMARK
jgi:CubicO group peptidase (beta-lactamase class C family)